MLLKFYRGIGPGSILMAVISGFLIWLYPMIHPFSPEKLGVADAMPLFEFFSSLLVAKPKLATIIALILILIIAFYLTNFNTRLFFITERTLLPGTLYIILSGFFVSLQGFLPVLPAVLLLLMSLDRLLAAYRKSGIAYSFFDASLLLSLGSMFYFNLIWFFPVIIIGLLLLRTPSFREIALSVFGLITPYIVTYAILYIGGKDLSSFTGLIVRNIVVETLSYYWSPLVLTLFLLGTVILLIGIFHLAGLFNKKKIRTRKIFSILIWLLIFSVGIFFLVPSASIEIYYILLIPSVFVITHFIVFLKEKKIANIVFAIFVLGVTAVQILRIYAI